MSWFWALAQDSRRRISERPQHRSEQGLPENGFVFCSFNNSYKIVPQTFDVAQFRDRAHRAAQTAEQLLQASLDICCARMAVKAHIESFNNRAHLLREVAAALESTPAQVALAWVLGRDEVTSVTIGARSETQLMDNLRAGQLVLPAELREQLDKVSQPEKPYPYWMQQFHDKDRVLV